MGNFWFGFSVFALQNYVFSVLVFFPVYGFLQFRLGFSVFVKNDGGFSGLAKEVTPCSRAKIVIPRDHLHSVLRGFILEGWMTSLGC